MHHKGGYTNYQRPSAKIFLSILLIMIIGFTGFNLHYLTEHRAETEPHHTDVSLRTRRVHLSYTRFYSTLLDILKSLPRWNLVRENRETGEIRAERRTSVFRFVDDIQIIATQTARNETRLNLRSVSRLGKGDFGRNARNIRSFFNALDTRIAAIMLENTMASGAFASVSDRLQSHVERLALQIGERHFARQGALNQTADYIHDQFSQLGYHPILESFQIEEVPLLSELRTGREERKFLKAVEYNNVIAQKSGLSDEIIVVGAHFDTVIGSPGADDNASGVAVLLELAHLLQKVRLTKTILLVAFANEEPPFFRTEAMGSARFLRSSDHRKRKIGFMISLEMLGYYSDTPHSQSYPPFLKFFYPDRADFIAVVGDLASRRFVKEIKRDFRALGNIPVEALAAPRWIPGVDFSDQLNFWKAGIPAVMITDTAFYRNPHYHSGQDLPQTLDYEKMSDVTLGVFSSLLRLGKVIGLKGE